MRFSTGQRLANQSGSVLLITLALMIMMTIVAVTAINTSQTDIDLSFNQLHYDQAFYIAEAGLQKALLQLGEENTWEDGYVNVDFDQGLYSVVVLHSDVDSLMVDTIVIRSTGSVQDSYANLEALVVPRLWRPFQYAMFGEDSLLMTNSTGTDSYNSDSGSFAATVADSAGDVGSNGPIDLTNTIVVGGDASTALIDGITLCPTCSVLGDLATGIDPYVLEPLDDSEFVWAHDNNSAPGGFSGSYAYDGVTHDLTLATNEIVTLSSGVYYFDDVDLGTNGQLLIEPGASVMVYMTGDLTLQNNTSVNPTGDAVDLLIFSKGAIFTMGMSIDICAAFYGPDADVEIGNGCDFYGSIVAASVYIDNAAYVHYDRALTDYAVGVTGDMVLIAWRER